MVGGTSCDTDLRWMSLDLTMGKPSVVQVMAWCRQATSHFLSQRWPRFCGHIAVNRPQCARESNLGDWKVLWGVSPYHTLCVVSPRGTNGMVAVHMLVYLIQKPMRCSCLHKKWFQTAVNRMYSNAVTSHTAGILQNSSLTLKHNKRRTCNEKFRASLQLLFQLWGSQALIPRAYAE